jgi:alpha-L-fucosidase
MGGMGGTGDTAGTGGMGVSVLISQGKPATSDSEQTAQNHLATHANDGDTSTRWCAANNALNHYLRVDLGESRTLTKVHLLWEKEFAYLFKIETSTDDAQWSMAIDKTTSSSASASQDHTMPANTKGRYVRLTVTGGLTATTWASLYEAEIFGY